MTELHLNEPVTTTEQAAEVVDTYWDEAHPKPIAPYHKIRGIVRRCMDAGFEPPEIIQALHNTDAFTLSAIEYTLRYARKHARNQTATTARTVPIWTSPTPGSRRLSKEEAAAKIQAMRDNE